MPGLFSAPSACCCDNPIVCCTPDYDGLFDVNISNMADSFCSDCERLNGLFTLEKGVIAGSSIGTLSPSCVWGYNINTWVVGNPGAGCISCNEFGLDCPNIQLIFYHDGNQYLAAVYIVTPVGSSPRASAGIFIHELGETSPDCGNLALFSPVYSSTTNIITEVCDFTGVTVTVEPS